MIPSYSNTSKSAAMPESIGQSLTGDGEAQVGTAWIVNSTSCFGEYDNDAGRTNMLKYRSDIIPIP